MRLKFYRYPRTMQEAKALADAEDQGVTVRAKRNLEALPDSWNGIGREYRRSWKDQRKSQHR